MSHRLGWVTLGILAVLTASAPAAAQTGITRYVNPTDATCGGHSPCYATIQTAVDAVQAGDTIQIQAGSYVEQVAITGKNNTAGATEASRIILQADPAAALGSVVLQGAVTQCTNGFAIRLQQSKFLTIRGLTITGAGGQAISLLGGINQNQAIHIERNRIVGNGSPSCDGGITIARGNPDTLIANNLIYANGRNGLATIDADGGPHDLISNTIHGNGWSGVNITRNHQVVLVNNAITGNGTQAGSTGGRFGVTREASTAPDPTGIQLLNNLICGNRLGEINGPALDATDSGTLTPTGTEGPGVSASPGCDNAATVYKSLAGPDGLVGTADDNFTLAPPGSPAIDRGLDPRTLGLPAAVNPLLEADFAGNAARPKNGTGAPTALFDMGALEAAVPDTQAPAVSFLQPAVAAHLRQTVTVQAQATDAGSGVASLTLKADTQDLTATLSPTLPPPAASVTATASWTTTTFADGTHTLTATATDQATNTGTAQRVVIVDNTPPDTSISSGPTGEIATSSATVTYTGTDNITPVGSLVFAWRLDGGPYTTFSAVTTATLTGLTEGAHTVDVKARDLAGNEDATPAIRTFTVRFGPSISNLSPATGPIGTLVTITGTSFEPGTTTVTFNGVAAILRTLTATEITTTVPIGAATGPLVVTTSRGNASAPFTVTLTGDFIVTAAPAAPATVRVIAGDQGTAQVLAAGSGSFTSLVTLGVSSGPTGITRTLSQPAVAPGASASVIFGVAGTVAAGTYAFTVTGQAQVDGLLQTRTASVSLEVLPADTRAVTGQVLTAEAVPVGIPGVTVTLGSAVALTDAVGNFTLLDPPAGPTLLLVDGRTASTPAVQYPPVEVPITVAPSGPTRVPFPVYLPKLDTAHPITLPLDASGFTTQQVLATTPLIPGLVVTIPAGTKITGPDGTPVSQITITAVPVDRSPMPFPPGVTLPMLLTIQPGGAVPSQPLPISFPNAEQAPVGSQADLYFFDLVAGSWATWGTGTVSPDGTQIVSDPGFGLPRFAWHGAAQRTSLSDQVRSTQPGRATGGEPVDLPTGRFTVRKTDLVLPGRLPVTLQRFYRSESPQPGLLGIGWALDPYETVLLGQGSSMVLISPDQSRAVFTPTGPGQWQAPTEPGLLGAILTQLPGDFLFQLRLKDGTVQRYERIFGFANLAGLAAITDRTGNTVTLTREQVFQQNKITRITEPAGRALTLTYDTAGRISTITDPIGRVVQYAYDPQGRLSTVTDPAGGQTRYTYDAGGHRVLTITDPRGIPFLTNEYDANGRVSRQTQADGDIFTFAYTLDGVLVTQTTLTDPRGNATTYRFDARGNTLSQTDALGQTTVFDYELGSNLLRSTTDPLGRVTRLTYDSKGNVTSITDPAGNVRSFTYEGTFNRVTAIRDPLGNLTSFSYDAQGNLTSLTDPLGATTAIAYNASGQPTSTTDPLLNTTTFGYDAVGNLTTIADPLANTTRRSYDAVSRLIAQTDPRGNPTTFAYDPLNRPTQLLDPLGGVTRFSYDGNGNLLTVTDARGNTTTHSYDSMDRLVTRTDPVNATESFQYDGLGNLTRHTDRKGQVASFSYDGLNRRAGAAYADGSSTSFAYDSVGRLVQATDSVGGTILNQYDSLDRLVAQGTGLGTVSYQYDALGRRTRMDAAGQASVFYGYDAASRLRAITQAPLNPVTIDYDALGRRTRLTLPNQVSTESQYDAASRLTALIYRNATGQLGDLTYQYDAAGNRTGIGGSFARTGLPTAIASASYDAANRQLTVGGQMLTYDANGNLVSDGTTTYTWDARNRLAALSGPTPASFQYDPLGRRARKTINGSPTDFAYDGLNPVQELSGATGVATLLTGLGIDESLTRTDGEGKHGLLTDALGSTLALTDAAGAVPTSYTYEPFGASTLIGAPTANSLEYTGRENDGTGLYYYRARYYSPALQRFVSEDPIRLFSGTVNFYGYVSNNPLVFVDPFGLDRLLNPYPAGPNGPRITFDPGANNEVSETLADIVEEVVVDTSVDINISATTNGVHTRNSLHYEGNALDINRVNGVHVGPTSSDSERLQKSFDRIDNVVENFGPFIVNKNGEPLTGPAREKVAKGHRRHIHIGVSCRKC